MDQLLSQHARNQFVAQTFHIELDNQKAVHELFLKLRDELERRTEDFSKRMVNINSDIEIIIMILFINELLSTATYVRDRFYKANKS